MSLHLITASSAPAAPATDDPGVVVCLACRLDFDHFTRPGEPGYFAAEHNRQHHGGHPVAFVTTVDAPAGPVWHVQPCTAPGCDCRQWLGDEDGSWMLDDDYAAPDFCLCGHGWFHHPSVPQHSTPDGGAA